MADATRETTGDATADATVKGDAATSDAAIVGSYLGAAGLGVSDLAASTDFYTKSLGMSIKYQMSTGYWDEVVLEFKGSKGSAVVLLHFTDGSERNYKNNPVKLAFYVPDAAKFAQNFKNAGLPVPREPAPLENFGNAIVGFAKDPDGYLIEIVQDSNTTLPYLAGGGIGVTDLAASTAFYTNVIGMVVKSELKMENFMDEVVLGFPSGKGSGVVLMHYNDGSERNYKNNPVKLVFYVPKAADTANAIQDAGMPIVSKPAALAELGNVVVGMAKDPDGYLLEIVEQTP
jgi:catechol 2,3-dioxygenase-like lactoylglutathione lyase family enzyme